MKHIEFYDYLKNKILNEDLKCKCENCLEKYENWERERKINFDMAFDELLKLQEKKIKKKISKGNLPLKFAFSIGFFLLIFFGFFGFIKYKNDLKFYRYEKEYKKVIEFYEKPVLGELEALSIIFNEEVI